MVSLIKKLNSKLPTGSFILLLPILIYIIKFFIAPIIKVMNPSTYTYFENLFLDYGMSLFTYPILFWFIGLIYFYITELYLYLSFQLNIENSVIPNYLPNFAQKWLLNIKKFAEEKDTEKRQSNLRFYFVPLIIQIIVTILFAYVAIFYLNDIKVIF